MGKNSRKIGKWAQNAILGQFSAHFPIFRLFFLIFWGRPKPIFSYFFLFRAGLRRPENPVLAGRQGPKANPRKKERTNRSRKKGQIGTDKWRQDRKAQPFETPPFPSPWLNKASRPVSVSSLPCLLSRKYTCDFFWEFCSETWREFKSKKILKTFGQN